MMLPFTEKESNVNGRLSDYRLKIEKTPECLQGGGFWETSYQNKGGKNEHLSSLMTLKGGSKVTIWGKDLKNHFESEKLQPGTLIKVKTGSTLVRSQCLMMMELLQARETHHQ